MSHGSGPVSAEMGVPLSLTSSTDSEDPVLDSEAHLTSYSIPIKDPVLSTCSFEELNAVTALCNHSSYFGNLSQPSLESQSKKGFIYYVQSGLLGSNPPLRSVV